MEGSKTYQERYAKVYAALQRGDYALLRDLRAKEIRSQKSLVSFLDECLDRYGCTKAFIIKKTNASKSLIYKVFEGEKKLVDRNLAIRIALAMRMGVDNAQALLRLAGLPELSADNLRDGILMMCLDKAESIIRADEWLEGGGLEGLFGMDVK